MGSLYMIEWNASLCFVIFLDWIVYSIFETTCADCNHNFNNFCFWVPCCLTNGYSFVFWVLQSSSRFVRVSQVLQVKWVFNYSNFQFSESYHRHCHFILSWLHSLWLSKITTKLNLYSKFIYQQNVSLYKTLSKKKKSEKRWKQAKPSTTSSATKWGKNKEEKANS